MKVLVTGGAGFIGSHLVDRLCADGHEVVVVDNLYAGSGRRRSDIVFHRESILDYHAIRAIFMRERPDTVCHFAAKIDVAKSMKQPADDAMVNIIGGLNVLEASLDFGVSRFVFASTGGAMYGNPMPLPASEDCPTLPIAPYPVSKMAFEHYLRVYQDRLPSISLRYASLYGPGQNPIGESGAVAIFTGRILRGEGVKVYGDGSSTRDYLYVTDAADAACRALNTTHATGPYNIGSGRQTSVLGLIECLGRITGKEIPIEFLPARPGEVEHIFLDSTKAHEDLGWDARVDLLTGLHSVVRAQEEKLAAG